MEHFYLVSYFCDPCLSNSASPRAFQRQGIRTVVHLVKQGMLYVWNWQLAKRSEFLLQLFSCDAFTHLFYFKDSSWKKSSIFLRHSLINQKLHWDSLIFFGTSPSINGIKHRYGTVVSPFVFGLHILKLSCSHVFVCLFFFKPAVTFIRLKGGVRFSKRGSHAAFINCVGATQTHLSAY